MSPKKSLFCFFILLLVLNYSSQKETKITGTPISSDYSSPLLNNVFDGDISTSFQSKQSSNGWVGLKLDSKYQITKIGFAVKTNNKSDFLLGVFEGSNDITFFESVPLYMIKGATENQMNYVNIQVSKKFKYIRYVGPNKKNCLISELEIYTDEDKVPEEDKNYYQPTNIPLISIHTEESMEPYDKENYINCDILIIDENKKNVNEKGRIKLRGNATMRLDKKAYKIKFDSKVNPLNLPAKAKTWDLLANHSDKTLLRTTLALKISELFEMKYTPQCQLVDVMVNGEYKGNYDLCDQVERHKGRVEVTEMDDTCIEEPEVTGGYLFAADAYAKQERDIYYETTKGIIYAIKYPEEEDIVSQQADYLTNYFNNLENEAYNNNVDRIDIESFCKYLLIEDLCGNGETYWSTYMTKEREDNKFYFGPVWDFDIAFDNDMRVYPTLEKKDFIFKYGTSAGTMADFALKILGNEEVLKELKNIWNNFKKEKITKEFLVDFINENIDYINESQKLNFMRWDILNKKVLVNPVARGSYKAETDYLIYYIQARYDILDEIVNKATIESINNPIKEKDKINFNELGNLHQ